MIDKASELRMWEGLKAYQRQYEKIYNKNFKKKDKYTKTYRLTLMAYMPKPDK